MRAVKLDKHNLFSDENDMYSYFMSAKTGDSVSSSFYRIAADLAGVVLTKPEIEVESKVVKAELVNHQQHDPAVVEPESAKVTGGAGGRGGKCVVM